MCDCGICVRSRSIETRSATMADEARKLIDELHDMVINCEMDRDYYKALVRGTWPDADNVIHQSRLRHKKD